MELTPFLFGLYKLVKYLLYPLTWTLLMMTMTTVLLCLPLSHRRLRWARISAVSALIFLVAISTPLVARPYSPPWRPGILNRPFPTRNTMTQSSSSEEACFHEAPSARSRISLLFLRTARRAAWTCSNKDTPTHWSLQAAVGMCLRTGRETLSK